MAAMRHESKQFVADKAHNDRCESCGFVMFYFIFSHSSGKCELDCCLNLYSKVQSYIQHGTALNQKLLKLTLPAVL